MSDAEKIAAVILAELERQAPINGAYVNKSAYREGCHELHDCFDLRAIGEALVRAGWMKRGPAC